MSTPDLARRITRGLHAARSSQELFAALRNSIDEVGHGGAHAVVLRDAKSNDLQICSSSEAGHLPGTKLDATDGPCLSALHDGETWYANGTVDRFHGANADLSVGAMLPLRTGDNECYGALVTSERILEEQRAALELVAEHLGLALVRVQLHEEISRQHQNDLTKLSLMSRAGEVIRSIELEPILAKLMELALSSVEAEVGCIVLCEDDGPRVQVEWGLGDELLAHLRVADGRSLVEAVLQEGSAKMAGHVPSDPDILADGPADCVGSLLAVPLATRERVLGCLIVARGEGGAFVERDLDLLSVTTGLSSNAIENALLHKTEVERERLQAELRLAGEVQMGLLPDEVPQLDGVDCAATVWPCDDSGGDYYDFMRIDDHRVAFCVGDATGHGIGAAFITTTARACLRACMGEEDLDLGALFGRVSGLLEDDLADGKFITMFLGVYDTRDRTISYVSAGHDPGLLYRASSNTFEELEATGAPLGIFPGLEFDAEKTAPLEPGDLLIVKTDGITEAENPAQEQFGDERLRAAIQARREDAPEKIVPDLHDEVVRYRDGAPQTDDVTVLCVKAQ